MSWKDTIEEDTTSSWKDTIEPEEESSWRSSIKEDDSPSATKTFAHKAGQGATFGFSDELYAALKSGSISGEEYEKIRDNYRKELKKMEEANPNAALAGDIVGGVATGLLVPWGSAGAIGKLGTVAAIGAAEGGLAGAGYSDDESIAEIAKDSAVGAGLGAAGGAVVKGLSKMLSPASRARVAKGEISEEVADSTAEYLSKNRETLIPEAELIEFKGPSQIAREHPEYARWSAKKGGWNAKELEKIKLNEEALSAKELKLLKEAGEQGRLTPESYMEFLEVEDFVRATNNKVATQELKGKLRSNWIIDNLEAVNVKARRLDDTVPEMQMEKIMDDANVIINKMDGEVSKYADDLTKISKIVSKEDPETLIKNIEAGNYDSDAAKAVKSLYDNLYEDAIEKGFKIDKLDNYVKKAYKSEEDILKTMLYKIRTEKVSGSDYAEVVRLYKGMFPDTKITSKSDLASSIENLLKNPKARDSIELSQTFKSAKERSSEGIPDWARETNITKLMTKSIKEQAQAKYLRPLGQRIKVRSARMRDLGLDDQAAYWDKYADDIMGLNKSKDTFSVKEFLKKMVGKEGVDTPTLDYVARQFANMPYIAHLGLSPVKVARNSLQNFNHTIPHMYGTSPTGQAKALKEWTKVWSDPRKLIGNTSEMNEYIKKGYIPTTMSEGVINDAIDMLEKSGTKINPAVRFIGDKWETFGKFALGPYQKSDTLNRVVTIRLSKDLASEIAKGSSMGIKGLNRLPKSLRAEVSSLIDEGATDIAEDKLVKHFLNKTQFGYNKSQRNLLARESRGLGVFQKWPVQVTSEILYDINKNGLFNEKTLSKYGVPAIAMGSMGAALYESDPKLYKDITGKDGAAGLLAWAPIGSAGSFGSLLGYQLDTIKDVGSMGAKAVIEDIQDSPYADKSREAFVRKLLNSGYVPTYKSLTKTGLVDEFGKRDD